MTTSLVNTKEGNEEGVDFYVVLCIHPMRVLEEDYTRPCHGGTQFQTSDVVVKGHTTRNGPHGNHILSCCKNPHSQLTCLPCFKHKGLYVSFKS